MWYVFKCIFKNIEGAMIVWKYYIVIDVLVFYDL